MLLRAPLEPAFEPEPYREPFFSLRRPSRSIFGRFIAHMLVRLMIVAPLPANVQTAAALFPVSMLWSLVPTGDQANGANISRGHDAAGSRWAERIDGAIWIAMEST